MTEKELEKKLVDKVKKLGGRAFKFVSPGNSGVPDRLVVLPGNKIAFVELKSPENKSARLSKLQECQIRFLKSLDCAVNVIRSEAQLDEFIKKITGRVRNETNIKSTRLSEILYKQMYNR